MKYITIERVIIATLLALVVTISLSPTRPSHTAQPTKEIVENQNSIKVETCWDQLVDEDGFTAGESYCTIKTSENTQTHDTIPVQEWVDCFQAGHTSNRLNVSFEGMRSGTNYCIIQPIDSMDF